MTTYDLSFRPSKHVELTAGFSASPSKVAELVDTAVVSFAREFPLIKRRIAESDCTKAPAFVSSVELASSVLGNSSASSEQMRNVEPSGWVN